MEYNPKWVVLSNDDMVKIDEISSLIKELDGINSGKTMAVCRSRSKEANRARIGHPKRLRNFLFRMRDSYTRSLLTYEKKFDIRFFVEGLKFPWNYLFRNLLEVRAISDFAVLSSDLFRDYSTLYDETFINGGEDIDLSIRLYIIKINYVLLHYRILSIGGGTIGSKNRMLKDIINLAYLNSKLLEYFHTVSKETNSGNYN